MIDLDWIQVSPKKVECFRAFASLLFHLAFPSAGRYVLTGIVNDFLGTRSKMYCAVFGFSRSFDTRLYVLELGYAV